MKTSEVLMTILITVLGILPFVWFTYIGKKASSKSKQTINNLLKSEQLNFNEKESRNNKFIGIDNNIGKLLYIQVKPNENRVAKIDLADVKSCKIHKETKELKRDNKFESELHRLHLVLNLKNKNEEALCLYDIEENFSEDFEMQRAEEWQKRIVNAAAITNGTI
ncbi:MAG TPA: hypothetical protein PKI08_01715 [Aquaticitalea sp.]|nr:hypothetical protein [Aquaticitalea sp.]